MPLSAKNTYNLEQVGKLQQQLGFTLIELMVVVGIIGILVAIAAPNYSRYQSKARQAEAKLALGAIYSAEKSFYAEYNAYTGYMDAIGYAPEGNKMFYRNYVASGVTVTGYSGGGSVSLYNPVNNPYSCLTALGAPIPSAGTDIQTFVGHAEGCIRNGAMNDVWSINETRRLSNDTSGL